MGWYFALITGFGFLWPIVNGAAKLPAGVTTLQLPEGLATFRSVKPGKEWLVEVEGKGLVLRTPYLFVRDGNNVLLLQAVEESVKFTRPNGTHSYCQNLGWVKGTIVVRPSRDGGFGRIRRGDVILTHPHLKIEVEAGPNGQ